MRWLILTGLLFALPAQAAIDSTDGAFSVDLLRPWQQSFSGYPGVVFEAKVKYRRKRSLIRATRLKRKYVEDELRGMAEEDIVGLDLKGAAFRTPGVLRMPLSGQRNIYFLAYRYRKREFKTGYFNVKGTSYALLTYNINSEDWQVLAAALSVEEPPDMPAPLPAKAPAVETAPIETAPVPPLRDAVSDLKACVQSILDCVEGSRNKLYRPCVRKGRRCEKDPRTGCCAKKCVKQFMRRLKTGKTDDEAFLEVFTYDGSCMPGIGRVDR